MMPTSEQPPLGFCHHPNFHFFERKRGFWNSGRRKAEARNKSLKEKESIQLKMEEECIGWYLVGSYILNCPEELGMGGLTSFHFIAIDLVLSGKQLGPYVMISAYQCRFESIHSVNGRFDLHTPIELTC